MSRTWHNQTALAHLIVDDSLSKPFDEFRHLRRILPLIQQPSRSALFQQPLRSLLDVLQRAKETAENGKCCEQSTNMPGEF